jgi:sec-independent protein translocase protein TatC
VAEKGSEMSFWDHLDVLRWTIIRSGTVYVIVSIVLFGFKTFLFDVVLAAADSNFIIYKWFNVNFSLKLINIEVAAQFLTHLKVAFIGGFVVSFPYITYELWKFIAPALYEKEKKIAVRVLISAFFLFYIGVFIGYFLIFPLALNFFQQYSVSDLVTNTISLNSYISLFFAMILLVGVLFEFPVLIYLLSSMGIVNRPMLRKYRRHAFVATVILGVIITSDPFSLTIVTLILYGLYEVSIYVCKKAS